MKKFKALSVRLKILVITLLLVYIGVWWVVGFAVGRKIALASEVKTPVGSLINEDIVPTLADVANPINGVWFTKAEAKSWQKRVPLAVMVENHVLARPHSGLYLADAVYEALAEGSVTRFMALFLSNSSSKDLGPARSARGYYLDWAREYGAAYAHWGGNESVRAAADKIFGKKDLDQFDIGSPTFFRRPPGGVHDAYTTTKGLWGVTTLRGVNKLPNITNWEFKEDSPLKKPKASTITVGFYGDPGYVVVWRYDKNTNSYKRSNGGYAHKDKVFNKQLATKNIVVQFVKSKGYKEVTPGVSNRVFQTTGSGKVLIFRDGRVLSGTWKKENSSARTRFLYKNGDKIPLNRGKIWIEIVPTDSPVSY
jgi:hypothetical protein